MRRARPGLGTIVDIAIAVPPGADASAIIEAAFGCVEQLEAQLSMHRADSALNRLCDTAHLQPTATTPAVLDVLKLALDLHRQSQGVFDVTIAPGSCADIELRDDGVLSFKKPLRLDLGGIAKGYVIDCVIELLQQLGVSSGRVNAGGDLRVFGETTEPVSLRFADGFRVVAQICDGAFAASTTGARPMSNAAQADELRHFDGRDREAVSGADTVAVFAGRAIIADALTKIALVNPDIADTLCAQYSAQWRRYPFQLAC
jgi:thiamine biosynthesis lipoprotein